MNTKHRKPTNKHSSFEDLSLNNYETNYINNIDKVHFKLPEFFTDKRHSPQQWLDTCINMCTFNGITNHKQICTALINKLTPDIIIKIGNDLKKFSTSNKPLILLREILNKIYPVNQHVVLEECYHDIELGDRKPSEYLADLKCKITDENGDPNNELIKFFFYRILPTHIKDILLTRELQDIDSLGFLADRLYGNSQSNVCTVTNTISTSKKPFNDDNYNILLDKFEQLLNENKSLKKEISELKSTREIELSRSSGEFTVRRPYHKSEFTNNKPEWCYYHNRFGIEAYRCIQPCKFKSRSLNQKGHPA